MNKKSHSNELEWNANEEEPNDMVNVLGLQAQNRPSSLVNELSHKLFPGWTINFCENQLKCHRGDISANINRSALGYNKTSFFCPDNAKNWTGISPYPFFREGKTLSVFKSRSLEGTLESGIGHLMLEEKSSQARDTPATKQ